MPVSEIFEQALAHHRAGRLPQAETLYLQVLADEPGHAEALHHYALIAHLAGHPDALGLMRRSLALRPDHAPYLNNLGIALHAHGRYDEAAEHLRRAVALSPDYADAHFNLAMVLLVTGDLPQGLREFEWRWKISTLNSFRMNCPQPRWDGGNVKGQRLLIHAEQGLGDTLQCIRYIPAVARHAPGAKLTVLCDPSLVSLLQRNLLPSDATVAYTVPNTSYDAWYPLMSLPLFFHTTRDTIPAGVPYLAAARREAKQWRERLAASDRSGCRVGLVWAGSKIHPHDRQRSLPLAALAPLGAVPGVSFYSLQKGEEARQTLFAPPGLRLQDFTGAWQNFDDTAAFVANLDLVITVDTAVAHLAGAMGKPVWILLPFVPDWRWLLQREDSPWYPTMRLFRQTAIGDWAGVVARVAGELAAARSGHRFQSAL